MPNEEETEQLNIIEALRIILQYKKFVILFTSFSAVLSIAIALWITPIYKAEVVIFPQLKGQGGSGVMDQLGGGAAGLASLAGIKIGAAGGEQKRSFAKLTSRSMKEKFIQQYNLLPILFSEQWNTKNNKWLIEEAIEIPTMWDAIKEMDDILFFEDDQESSLITLTMLWSDPILAAKWANDYIALTDQSLRDESLRQSERSLSFLMEQRQQTKLTNIQSTIDNLYAEELKNYMFATAGEEYFYHVIDPAIVPQEKFKPKRYAVVLIISFIGFLFSLFLVGFKQFYMNVAKEMNSNA